MREEGFLVKKGDLTLAVLLLILLFAGMVYRSSGAGASGATAVIAIAGEEVRRVDLSKVEAPFSFRLEQEGGRWDVIEVEKGRIRVAAASCPRQIAVRQGWISSPVQIIVCIPNQLTIAIEGETGQESMQVDGIVF